MTELRIELDVIDDVAVAKVFGEIDVVTHDDARLRLIAAALDGGPRFVIDLDGVSYVDSNGIRVLFALARELDHSRIEWGIALRNESPLHSLFKVTAFDEAASIFAAADEAIDAVKGRS
jgi:anti-anti-sigma factor